MPRTAHIHQRNGALGSIRELVFGLEDSLVSTLGVVVGVAAGTADAKVVILSGVVLVIVEALSMAGGSFLSSKSHRELLEEAVREEREEIEQEPERETEELRGMYKVRGFSDDEIEILVRRITANKDLWLEEMMAKELQIGKTDMEEPHKNAAVMFVSYVLGGAVPIVPYLFLSVPQATVTAISITIGSLFAVGVMKAKMTSTNAVRSGLEMVFISVAAAVIGYGIGKGLGGYFGIDVRG